MNFDLSDEQRQIEASVERFTASLDSAELRRLRAAPGGYPAERWRALANLGVIALAVGEESGGLGGMPIDLAIVAAAIGRAVAPDPWLENGVVPALILAFARRHDLLADVLSGERFVAFAHAERSQRFSLIAKGVTARRRGEGYVLHGEKTFVLGGAAASDFIISAECDGETIYLLVAADHDGVFSHPYRLADGSSACEIRFTDASLASDARLTLAPGKLAETIAMARLLAAAEMVGLAQRLLDETLGYVKQREQFGVAIGSFQALQHRLVECYAALEQSRSMVYRAALCDPGAASFAASAAGAKAFVSAQSDLIAREAVQMHGGMGITDELIIGHVMKRALLLARLFGDEDTVLAEYAEAA